MKLLTSSEILKLPGYKWKTSGKYLCCVKFCVNRSDFSQEMDFRHMMHTLKTTAKNKFSQYGIGPEAYSITKNGGVLHIEFDNYDIFVYLVSKFQKYLLLAKGPVSKRHAKILRDPNYIITEKKHWYNYVAHLSDASVIKSNIAEMFPREDEVYQWFGSVRIRHKEDLILFRLAFNDHITSVVTVIPITELIE
jgi:hypothetical protein